VFNKSIVENALGMEYYTQQPESKYTVSGYSSWVEGMILTSGSTRLVENTLGLVGEAGEVAEKVKKIFRDGNSADKDQIKKELGDVLFYVTALGGYFGITLDDILTHNVNKLEDRKNRGVLRGEGDNR